MTRQEKIDQAKEDFGAICDLAWKAFHVIIDPAQEKIDQAWIDLHATYDSARKALDAVCKHAQDDQEAAE